jgi:hypothetical protein
VQRRWRRGFGVAVVALLVWGAVAVVLGRVETGPGHPDEWDPRVVDLVDFVEGARDLTFDHPVYVDFLTAEEYTGETTSDEDAVGEEERADLDRYAGALRALGVGSGEIDLFSAYNQVSDAGTLAFYDPEDQRVKVRGTDLTVGLRVTLVHELTHALQDQHFDLDRLYSDDLDNGAATAFRALVEGDAMRIEDAYTTEELSADDQAAYDDEYASQLEDSVEATGDVPAFIGASFAIPYALGQPFVLMVANEGGNSGVDDAFDAPPDTEDDLFDPTSYLDEDEDEDLDLGLSDEVEPFDEGPLGSPSWYLMLAERIDPKVAFTATLGWGGDAYAFFERDDQVCVRAGFVGDAAADEEEMTAALDEWAAAMPGGLAEVVDIDGHPGIEACDPGEDVDMALTGRAENALFLPSLWGFLVADAASVLDVDGARCYARAVVGELTYDQISDPEGTAFQGDAFQETLMEAFQSCS